MAHFRHSFIQRSAAVKRLYNVFIREHQIVRFSIEIETEEDMRAATLEARKQYEQSGTQWSAHAETEIDSAEIFAVDELDTKTGSITQSFDFESLSASEGARIDLSN
jgi:putative heme iron utilization protein